MADSETTTVIVMSLSQLKGRKVDVKLWTQLHQVESSALDQLRNIAALPWVFHHVAAMPDVHFGKGATVGSVIAMKGAVAPAAVGVDIGCGMAAMRTNLVASDLPDDLKAIRSDLEAAIPVGFCSHDEARDRKADAELWSEFSTLAPEVQKLLGKARKQLGTLGGGNHFIELCLDTEQRVWLMLHSGSRNIGKELAEVHMWRAKKLAHNRDLPDRDLAVFLAGTEEMAAYRRDLFWAQRYARKNREVMLELAQAVLTRHLAKLEVLEAVHCHHNYVAEEIHYGEDVLVTRKGAIRAGLGDLGIIPGSMGTRSYIVRGLGCAESFQSASHGAGRRMSRGEAKRRFTVADLEKQTEGVECRKDAGVLDEIPGAYKSIDEVMANQRDLVEVVAELRQVMCIKG
ncbi:MAG: RtcB family protein [Polyangiaceae bacterium]